MIKAIIAHAKSLDITIDIDMSKETIDTNVSCLKQEVKSIHKNSTNKRDDMLYDRVNYSEDIDKTAKAKN